jgi:hypothetical protein
MSSILAIADALVALLVTGNNAGWFPLPIGNIDRRWAPDWQISDVANLRCSVIPRTETRTRLTRIGDDFTPVIDIALMRHLPQSAGLETTAVDAYAEMAQSVADIIARDQLTAVPTARLVSVTLEPIIDQERLVNHRCVFSVISTSWRYVRDARVPLPAVP